MRDEDLQKILEIGIALSAEKDYKHLLERILSDTMSLLNCDAGTLYLKRGDYLDFTILRNDTMHTYQGGDGEPVTLPPVPITRENVCTLALLENRTINIEDTYTCKEYNLSGPRNYDAITGYRTRSILVVPLRDRSGGCVGILQLLNAKDEAGDSIPFAEDKIKLVESIASQAAVAIQNMRYVEAIKELFQSLVRVLSAAIDERTPYNASHTRHMAEYGNRFIDYLNETCERTSPFHFEEEQKEETLMSVWFHDIGKLVTPLEVMNKESRLLPEQKERIFQRMERFRLQSRIDCLEGRIDREQEQRTEDFIREARLTVEEADKAGYLTDEMEDKIKKLGDCAFRDSGGETARLLTESERGCLLIRKGTLSEDERNVMEQHVSLTEKLLFQIQFPQEYGHVRDWAYSHHEYLDGSGYPRKLKDGEIPVEVRLITILDIFDALIAGDRPYKKGMPVEKALSILKSMADKEGKLDPELTELFVHSKCWEQKSDVIAV